MPATTTPTPAQQGGHAPQAPTAPSGGVFACQRQSRRLSGGGVEKLFYKIISWLTPFPAFQAVACTFVGVVLMVMNQLPTTDEDVRWLPTRKDFVERTLPTLRYCGGAVLVVAGFVYLLVLAVRHWPR